MKRGELQIRINRHDPFSRTPPTMTLHMTALWHDSEVPKRSD
jgi:hypothetical protein